MTCCVTICYNIICYVVQCYVSVLLCNAMHLHGLNKININAKIEVIT